MIRVFREIEDRGEQLAYAEECQQNFDNGGPRPMGNGSAGPSPYQREIEATYPYLNAAGQLTFEVVRFILKQPGGGYVTDARGKRVKTFCQRMPSGEPGIWRWGLEAGEYMRRAPGKDWKRFNATKFESYPASRERKTFSTSAPVIPFGLPELVTAIAAGQPICLLEGRKKSSVFVRSALPPHATPEAPKNGGPNLPRFFMARMLCCPAIMILPGATIPR
jgi:hypothetical protein